MELVNETEEGRWYECGSCGEEVLVQHGSVRLPAGHRFAAPPPQCPNEEEHE